MFAGLGEAGIGRYVLMPGDPGRVAMIAALWSDAHEVDFVRGFRAATGRYRDVSIGAFSSGIGGPSLEVALVQIAELGADTIIRVGTTGALREDIRPGDLVIDEAAVRLDGTSALYVRPEFPAAASYEVTLALIEACERIGVRYHVGVAATAGSFYTGQGRPSFGGYFPAAAESMLSELQQAGVINFEMEAATLFTLARLFGLRSGAVCAVVANRVTGEWQETGIEDACRVASEAVAILAEWDRLTAAAGKRWFFPGLSER
jgi:uridine phosphorylase